MTSTAKERATDRIAMRVRPSTKRRFEDAAAREGVALTTWLRQLGHRRVERLGSTKPGG